MAIQKGARVRLTTHAAAFYAPPTLNSVHGSVLFTEMHKGKTLAAVEFDNGEQFRIPPMWLLKLEPEEDTEKIRLQAIAGSDQFAAFVEEGSR